MERGETVTQLPDEAVEPQTQGMNRSALLDYLRRIAEATERIDERFRGIEEALAALGESKMLKLLGIGRGGNDGS